MNLAIIADTRIPGLSVMLCLGLLLIPNSVVAQYKAKPEAQLFIGARGGINLTNYASPLDKVRDNVLKPTGGFFIERAITPRIFGQLGLSYAPYTIKWALHSSSIGGISEVNYTHLHFLQSDLKVLYRLQRNSGARFPILISGGLFLNKLLDANIVSYYPKQNETYHLNDTESRPSWNAGISLGLHLQRTFANGSIFRLGGEWIRGLSSLYNDPMAATYRARPKTRAYAITFIYGIKIVGKQK